MNSKKVNWIFLAMVLLNIVVVILLIVAYPMIEIGIVSNLIVSQLLVLVPGAVGVLLAGENLVKLASFHKIKISSALMIVLFTILIMPLVTLINAISMLFVDNAVTAMSGEILEAPFIVMFTLVGILGPMNEELVCRGIVYQGYKRSGTMMQAMLLSAMVFALMHMNFNQAAYAFAIGILAVLLVEATGSIWSSVLLHILINAPEVCIMYLSGDAGQLMETQAQLTKDMLILVISVYLLLAAVTTSLAGCVLAWIAKNEGRGENLRAVWRTRKEKKEGKVVTIPLLTAIVIALFYMSLEIVLL